MTKEEALARLAESRRALHQAFEGLSKEEMTQVQAEGVWTIPSTLLRTGKDVLGHITSWEETCLGPLRRYADGGPFEVEIIEDYLAWNAALLRHRTCRPLANETSHWIPFWTNWPPCARGWQKQPAGCRPGSGSKRCPSRGEAKGQ
jgi:hypothetical protein